MHLAATESIRCPMTKSYGLSLESSSNHSIESLYLVGGFFSALAKRKTGKVLEDHLIR